MFKLSASPISVKAGDDCMQSDHFPIFIYFHKIPQHKNSPLPTWNVKRANWQEFSVRCVINLNAEKVEDMCDQVTNALQTTASETVPRKSNNTKYNCPWWTTECKLASARRKRALRRFRSNRNNLSLLLAYKKEKALARRTVRDAKRQSWFNFMSLFNHNTPLSRLWGILTCFTDKRFRRTPPHTQKYSPHTWVKKPFGVQ